jgi:hypothetical protein
MILLANLKQHFLSMLCWSMITCQGISVLSRVRHKTRCIAGLLPCDVYTVKAIVLHRTRSNGSTDRRDPFSYPLLEYVKVVSQKTVFRTVDLQIVHVFELV